MILYTLLSGTPPFYHRHQVGATLRLTRHTASPSASSDVRACVCQSMMHERAMNGDYDFHKRRWIGVSWEVKVPPCLHVPTSAALWG